jgi:hypothetical protein
VSDDRHDSDVDPVEPDHRLPDVGPNGARPNGMNTRPARLEEVEEPVDLVAVQADDELINALAAGMSVSAPGAGGYDADDRVAAILAAWKAEVDTEPVPELVDLDTAVAAVHAGRPRSRRARHLVPIAAAAAFIVLAIGGLSVGSYNAHPNDMLWGVSKVLYSERAVSVQAAAQVEQHITLAKEALVAGEPVQASKELAKAEASLAAVRPEEGRDQLAETQDFLAAKAAETPQGQPTNPGTPLSTQPQRPVPPGAATDTSPSTGSSSATSSESVSPDPSSPSRDPRRSEQQSSEPPTSRNPEYDLRMAPGGPGPESGSDTSPPESTSAPSAPTSPGDPDEGSPDPTTGGEAPTATPEGKPDPATTSKAPPPSSPGGGSEGGEGEPTSPDSRGGPTSN